MTGVPSDPDRTLYLVDGTSNLFRAFFAIRGLSTRRGVPTNAVYGFTTMLRKLLREQTPRYLGVAFDLSEPTFRHQAYADYKAHRPDIPESLIPQIPYAKQVCRIFNAPVLELAGYEADDLIGTLTDKGRAAGFQVIIVASDKDLLQLVGDGVWVYNPVRDEFLDSAGVERVFGVRPEQVRDVLALCGDASDNIPGVEGIGEKGARDLIRRFGDLESVLREAPNVERKSYREGLLAQADAARLSRDLATVKRDVPVDFDPEQFRSRPVDETAARALFQELEFGGLLKEFSATILPSAGRPTTVILDAAGLDRAVISLKAMGTVAINLERDHLEAMRARPLGIALAGSADDSYYIPLVGHGLGSPQPLSWETVSAALRPLLCDPSFDRSGHNVKTDRILLRRLGIDVPGYAFDSMIASYLLDSSRRSHALDIVAQDLAGLTLPSYEGLLKSGARRETLQDVPLDQVASFAGARMAGLLAIRPRMMDDLRAEGLVAMLSELELPLAAVLADMEIAGVRIDSDFLRALSGSWEADLSRLTQEIHRLAGREFNINSPRQLGEVLFESLKLAPGRRTQKTKAYSTGVEVLEELAERHPLPRLILEYRELQKLKSTYVDTLPLLVNPETGRVHTSFNQTVAATGRLSSSDPNLQNIPIRTEVGRQIRRAFVADRDCVLLSADYSQVELRIMAHVCGDPALIAAFRAGEDVHRRTAAEVLGVLPELVTDEMRRRAKAVNFGILYGMGPQRLARDQGMTLKEAQQFIERYFGRFQKVKEYIDRTIEAAEREGRVRTLFQRLRILPELQGEDRNARQQAIRAAVNTTIQGTAADLIKMAMVVLARRLREEGHAARMTLQVHDELVLEVPSASLGPVTALVRDVMENVYPLSVPLIADLHAGPNWLEMDDLPSTSSRSKK